MPLFAWQGILLLGPPSEMLNPEEHLDTELRKKLAKTTIPSPRGGDNMAGGNGEG